jgi:hypothetical protein
VAAAALRQAWIPYKFEGERATGSSLIDVLKGVTWRFSNKKSMAVQPRK